MVNRKERTNNLKGILADLTEQIVRDPEELRKFTEMWQGGFHSYSLNNLLLIRFQRPDAALCAGYNQWKNKHGRVVKKGEKAMYVLAPMIITKNKGQVDEHKAVVGFTSVAVFDIKQTGTMRYFTIAPTGQSYAILDEIDMYVPVGCSDLIKGDLKYEMVSNAMPFDIIEKDLGLANGMTDKSKILYINPNRTNVSKAATTVHEAAHNLLGHTEVDGFIDYEGVNAKEIEAEAVKFIVMTYFGVEDNRAKNYIGNWGGHEAELKGRSSKILTVAEKIIRLIESSEAQT